MGKKGEWFSAVKKALSPQSDKKNQRNKNKKEINEEIRAAEVVPSAEQVISVGRPPTPTPTPPPPFVVKSTEIDSNDEQNNFTYSVAVATTAPAEAAVVPAQVAWEVVRLTTVPHFLGKSVDEIAVIKIQIAFRGYLARRALRALRGLARLKSLIEGQSVKCQAATALRCMQTLARVQSQIRARRIRMSEENLALQRQLQQKHEKELEKLRMGEIWDDSIQSKEQIEASLQSKQEAAMRRERALAYAFTHQQPRKNNKKSNPTFMDPNNPQWGWSWMERWMASRPWESRSMVEKDITDHDSVKSLHTLSIAGEINRAYALCELNIDSNKLPPSNQRSSQPPSRQSPSTPGRVPTSTPRSGKAKPGISKANGLVQAQDDNTKSTTSIQAEQNRRHSAGGSLMRDDENLASSPSVPSYMASTRSAKAKTKPHGPLGAVENNGASPSDQKPPFVGSVKKRLSFSASPRGAPRRHSVPGKFESTPVKDVPVEIFVNN